MLIFKINDQNIRDWHNQIYRKAELNVVNKITIWAHLLYYQDGKMKQTHTHTHTRAIARVCANKRLHFDMHAYTNKGKVSVTVPI